MWAVWILQDKVVCTPSAYHLPSHGMAADGTSPTIPSGSCNDVFLHSTHWLTLLSKWYCLSQELHMWSYAWSCWVLLNTSWSKSWRNQVEQTTSVCISPSEIFVEAKMFMLGSLVEVKLTRVSLDLAYWDTWISKRLSLCEYLSYNNSFRHHTWEVLGEKLEMVWLHSCQ